MQEEISKKQLREFGLLLGLGYPIIIGWLIPAIWGHFFKSWTLWIGIPSLILGVFSPGTFMHLRLSAERQRPPEDNRELRQTTQSVSA